MKNKIAIILFAIFSIVFLVNVSAKENKTIFTEGIFWKIEKDGEYVGHIFGTLHMNDQRIAKLHDKVNKY